jgi:hypothetical protein
LNTVLDGAGSFVSAKAIPEESTKASDVSKRKLNMCFDKPRS